VTRTPSNALEGAAHELEGQARVLGEKLRSAELSAAEREQIEDLLLADDQLFEQVLIAEDELIDALEADEGGGGSRGIPDSERRMEFADALRKAATVRRTAGSEAEPIYDEVVRRRSRRRPLWAAVAASLLLTVSALWWVARSPTENPETEAFVLSPSSTRGAPTEAVLHPPRGRTVELWLELESESAPGALFAADLLGADGELRMHREGLQSEGREWGRVVVFEVPGAELEPGRYRIQLKTGGADGNQRLLERYDLAVGPGENE
jgi:hypothetical protein